MKKRILAVLLSLTLAGALAACGGSKQGAETATVAADESISDLSMASEPTADATGSTVTSAADTAADSAKAAETTPQAEGTDAARTDVITPIPAQEVTDGTVPGEPVADTAATDGAVATEPAGEQSKSQTMIVTADINVREEPDFEGDILGGFEEGDTVTVTGSEGEWYIVDYKGETGYIYHKYTKAADSSSSAQSSEDSSSSKYGKLIDGDGDPVDLRYYDGSYEIYDENGNEVIIEGVND